MQARRLRKWILRPILAIALAASLFTGVRYGTSNFGTVATGRIYRSAQMSAGTLARTIREREIKTVLNLRGSNPDPWYVAEKAATLGAGATQVDVHLASDLWVSKEQAKTLLQILDTCEYPLLIHCQWGAERTGLLSAMTELLRPGATLDDARRQFSLYYLYVPAGDGVVMAAHLDNYADWLRSAKQEHSPAQFRRWLETGYRPGHPSAEDWPYFPYPLVSISKPGVETTHRYLEDGRGLRR